ncbi:MAG: hypothetical protein WA609_09515 [Terriglobales bacterium]
MFRYHMAVQNSLHMIARRLGAFLLLAVLATAQQTAITKTGDPSRSEPKLPVIDDKGCPDTNRRTDGVIEPIQMKLEHNCQIYSSWNAKRVLVAKLKPGEAVSVLSGIDVIREPDQVRVLQPSGSDDVPRLKAGDEVLGYGLRGDGDYVFWAKGVWYTQYYELEGDLNGGCGFADKRECSFAILKKGVQEWWVHVKTSSGLTGWMLAGKVTREKSWSDANFSDLCRMD